MSPMHYLLLGYGLIWLGLGVYLFQLNRRLDRVHRDIAELRERLERTRRV
ncbi:MAG: CcmD family protein [Candidatus Eisenbacteria bacterium]|uniref:CcmD family protein n=1 Tax=Eiseniibacteriota bacterium TaxID=2212470 RepID=A0A956LX40_UNCEI|nr:CcmD family protein [Candidatus Eisenbacteria bacterium]